MVFAFDAAQPQRSRRNSPLHVHEHWVTPGIGRSEQRLLLAGEGLMVLQSAHKSWSDGVGAIESCLIVFGRRKAAATEFNAAWRSARKKDRGDGR